MIEVNRQARPQHQLEAMAAAVEIAAKVTDITGIDFNVWAARFGQPVGTISWSCQLESQSQFYDATQKLTADRSYVESALALSDMFEGNVEDSLVRVVSGAPAESPSKFYVVTVATMANGKYKDAMEWGVAMQQYSCDGMNAPGMFGSTAYGGFADVGWLMGFDSMDGVDAGADWQATDAGYHERIHEAKDLFIPGSGHQRLIERLN